MEASSAPPADPPADLLAALLGLTSAADLAVGADGFNPHFQYAYMTEDSLFKAARAALAEVGLSGTISFEGAQHEQVVRQSERKGEVPQTLATITAVLTLRHASGQVEVRAVGQGLDPQDKAYAKAMTMAAKYAVQKGLMIAVEHGDDTDAGGNDAGGNDARGGGRQRSSGGGQRATAGGQAASSGQLGFVCSLIRKAHLLPSGPDGAPNSEVEALALRLARMRGDSATEFAKISKAIASDLIERLQTINPTDALEVLARLEAWEAENGVARTEAAPVAPTAEPEQPAPTPAPAHDADDDIPF